MFGENDFMLDAFYKRLYELRNQKGVSAREMSLALGQSGGYMYNKQTIMLHGCGVIQGGVNQSWSSKMWKRKRTIPLCSR